jgi:hypothetical protein
VVAADDRPILFAHQVDDLATEGYAVDQVAVEHDGVGLEPLQFDEHRFQRGQVAVDVGEDCHAHQLNTLRAITSRLISLVPSPMVISRVSRYMRSTSNSRL